jgi:hypothetical protein
VVDENHFLNKIDTLKIKLSPRTIPGIVLGEIPAMDK